MFPITMPLACVAFLNAPLKSTVVKQTSDISLICGKMLTIARSNVSLFHPQLILH